MARRRAIPFVGPAWPLELRRDVGDGRDVAGDHVEASRPHELVRRAPAEAAVGGDLEVAVTASDEDDTAQGGPRRALDEDADRLAGPRGERHDLLGLGAGDSGAQRREHESCQQALHGG